MLMSIQTQTVVTDDQEFLKIVQLRIALARKRANLTQEEAAFKCKVSVRGYQAIESTNSKRRFNPGLLTLWQLSQGLQVPLEELVKPVSRDEKRLTTNSKG